ncbi:hypothetical protein F2Q68_00036410 [Brassica cretica]|uniref:Uncharacterized protein n=1 Tax=Brassica cretica TaxID=69181 RepID=A0A8S9H212_BRACR|nr:hypothetical protein F2Q68_00036410 [Brassica cretica]
MEPELALERKGGRVETVENEQTAANSILKGEWKKLHMEKFIEASKKFIEWKKNPDGRSREEFVKFVEEDLTAA